MGRVGAHGSTNVENGKVYRGLPGLYHLPLGKELKVYYSTRLHLRVLTVV
jgi:hypothetical protein